MDEPRPADSDTRDWTFVIDEGCAQCGYVPHEPTATVARLRDLPGRWAAVLQRPGAAARPSEGVWSPVEYACHSRDLLRVLGERVALMLDQDEPTFPDYDGEAEAVRGRFWAADPAAVAEEIRRGVEEASSVYERVAPSDWERRGLRGDGRVFTIVGLSRFLVHDHEHHLHDVGA